MDIDKKGYVEIGIPITDEKYLDKLITALVRQDLVVYMSEKDNLKELVILLESRSVYDSVTEPVYGIL